MRHLMRKKYRSLGPVITYPTLFGFDEREEESEEESESEEETSEEEDDPSSEEEDKDDEEDEDDEDPGEDASGLKSALQKERKARKALKKELKELKKFKDQIESKNKTEAEKAKDKANAAEKRVKLLEQKYAETLLDFEVSEAARKARFRDTDDALRLIDRDGLVEVDDEEVTVDQKAVEKAVKAVAEAKPHLVVPEGEPLPKSGSKFGGKKKDDKKATEEQLKSKYPALNR